MRTRRNTLKMLGGIVGTGAFATNVVSASDPLPREETKRFYTHQDVQDELDSLQRRARGAFELEDIGDSLEGRELTVARVGSGDTDVFFTTEQHGDEPTGTNAILEDLREIATTNTPLARTVRENLTVHVLPMHNPDGAMRNQRRNARPDDYTWEDPYFGEQSGPADPNRQHYFNLDEEFLADADEDEFDPDVGIPDENPSPETQAMLDYVVPLEPEWVADLHTQSFMYHGGDYNPGDMHHSSNYWFINEGAVDRNPEGHELSRRMNVAMYDRADGFANAAVTVYPGGTTLNIARNAHGAYGYGSILNEMTGQIDDRGNRMEGQMVRIMREENAALLEGTADGSLDDLDPDRVEEIPDRGDAWWWPWDEGYRPEPE
ncbi:M14 family zinc carboxypeptidase [Natronococcus sp. A-GB7]|uniref:M14 family zinc carboxypeptidase n=1 Tax=Natronococcus sp. A-GB7 TaxID=3037649 RepID=UPI0024202DAC|nr:M14 family zinc carboxypeptidase [Natronococcus sp. A-GB7]MDG5818678.1 M14 family zinc carboxypeptidase [Natronococcus sp. A-GB7]